MIQKKDQSGFEQKNCSRMIDIDVMRSPQHEQRTSWPSSKRKQKSACFPLALVRK